MTGLASVTLGTLAASAVSLRTIALPVGPTAAWDAFAWPSKDPADLLDYTLLWGAWQADAGRAAEAVAYDVDGGLQVVRLTYVTDGTAAVGCVLRIGGGTPLADAHVGFGIRMNDGQTVHVLVALPVRAGLPAGLTPVEPVADGALLVGGMAITIGWLPILLPPPGTGAVTADSVGITADSALITADAA